MKPWHDPNRKNDEHWEQAALMRWWAIQCKAWDIPELLLMAIPNGGKRNAVTGAMLKAEGLRAGIPDMFLAYPKNGQNGLWIELKRKTGGKISEKQKIALNALSGANYAISVCYGWEQARKVICRYLGKEEKMAAGVLGKAGGPWQKWGNDDGGEPF